MAETVIDNGDAGHSTIETWGGAAGGINNDQLFYHPVAGEAQSIWNFGPLTGTYQIFVHWTTDGNRATNAPFTVKNHIGVVSLPSVVTPVTEVIDDVDETGGADANATTIDVNMQVTITGDSTPGLNSDYLDIGTYGFGGSGDVLVILTNNSNGYVIADAVKFVDVPPPRPSVRVQAFRPRIFAPGLPR